MSELNSLLGLRTDFSLGESAIASESVVEIAKKLGQTHVAVADTMNVSALIDVAKKAGKEGIELHMGTRVRIVDDPTLREKSSNKGAWFLKLYPKNEDGMRQLYKLITRGHDDDRFYVTPRLAFEDVLQLEPGSLVVTTGDSDGLFARPEHAQLFEQLIGRFPTEDVFIELLPVPTPYFERININAIRTGATVPAVRYIVAPPTLFSEGEFDAFFLNMAIQNRSDMRRPGTVREPTFRGFAPRSPASMVEEIRKTVDGIRLTEPSFDARAFSEALRTGNQAFLAATPYRWSKQPVALPRLAADPNQAVIDACKAGMRDRLQRQVFGFQPSPAEILATYIPRLKYELGVLKNLGFADYFLVVSDLVQWAKREKIMVGPGRGSVGGSLVAFLMGITDIDPIRFGLLFERFINPSRNDLPDADLDFMSTRREEVIRYLEQRYGTTHVAGINNYGVLQAASSIKAIARVYGMNTNEITATKLVPKEHGQPVSLEEAHRQVADIQRFATDNPRVWKGALAVQGVMNVYGRHAAGTIVSGVPIVERAVVERDGDGRKVNWDMRVCEDQGLVKMDILGLSTLDTLSRAVAYIKQRHGGRQIDLMAIPLDDDKTLKAFSRGETIGIFQFEGGAARRILKDMAQSSDLTFNDLVAANALNRPGPIDAGLVKDYVDARNGNRIITVPHPNMEAALAETYSVIVYQEQVMRVATDLSGFTLSEADKLRKAMGKKDKVLMATFRQQFVDGAKSHSGMDEAIAGELFDQIEVFAGYAFNKSHAAEYSLISYQAMWLKVHYPVEFYAAALSTVDEKKLQVLVADAKVHGIEVRPPDINISTNEFEIATDTLLYIPFNRIKGISEKTGQAILDARRDGPFTSIADLTARVQRRVCNVRHTENLNKVGAFARIEPGQLGATHESRRKEQMTLLPGLMTGVIVADRDIPRDNVTLARLLEIINDMEAVNRLPSGELKPQEDQVFQCKPLMGRKARMMVVQDSPNRSEEFARKFTEGDSFSFSSAALLANDMTRNDAYWTGLVKKRKEGRSLTTAEIKHYTPILEREIELLKPPLILTLGSAAARHFIPDLKGPIDDHVGRVFWDEKLDAMILIGFNPQSIYHDPDKLDALFHVFELAKSIIRPDE